MTIDTGTTAWMLMSTALVLLMIPGLAMFYGGLVRTKNVIGTMMHSFIGMAVIGFLWVAVGYSLSFGKNILGGAIGWNWDYFFLHGIDDSIVNGIPEYVIAMFQGKFAIITPALISGALAERISFRGYIAFIVLWFLFVYCPLAHWVWASDGWLMNSGPKGVVDLAGGLVIHVSAGASALVAAIYVGKRRGYPQNTMNPNNLVMTMMGAGLLWVGWFGFNAGSTLSGGLDAARALTMTQVSGATGAFAWMIIESVKFKKITSLGFVSGILAGLVVITPAAAVVPAWAAMCLGAISATACYYAVELKSKFGYDDSLDCFGIHGVGSGLGVLLLPFFMRESWLIDATAKASGFIWSRIDQFAIQGIGFLSTIALAMTMTLAICILIEKTIRLRLTKEQELAGLDHSLHGEHGYGLISVD